MKSLDDFKETDDLRMDDEGDKTSRREMRLSSMDEVEEYFKEKAREQEELIRAKTAGLADLKEELKKFKQRSKEFLVSR